MPNWNTSKVTITGGVEDLQSILRRGATSEELPFSFGQFFPTPEYLLQSRLPDNEEDMFKSLMGDRDHEYSSSYYWRLAFWGTKWDLSESTVVDDSMLHRGSIVIE